MRYRKLLKKWEKTHVVTTVFQLLLQNQCVAPFTRVNIRFKQAEAIATELRVVVPHEALDFLVLAWHQDHLSSQSGSKHKRSHQRERDFWLACADALLDDAFDTLKALVFD